LGILYNVVISGAWGLVYLFIDGNLVLFFLWETASLSPLQFLKLCRFHGLVLSWPWGLFLLNPVSLLFGNEWTIAFSAVARVLVGLLWLTQQRIIGDISFLHIGFALLIKPFLAGTECLARL
jgi:hypothetical protein